VGIDDARYGAPPLGPPAADGDDPVRNEIEASGEIMKQSYNGPEAKLAAGVKAATLITLVGLIAIVAHPKLITGEPPMTTGASDGTPSVVAVAPGEYFPSKFVERNDEGEAPPQSF
jgi:hypothetical protein